MKQLKFLLLFIFILPFCLNAQDVNKKQKDSLLKITRMQYKYIHNKLDNNGMYAEFKNNIESTSEFETESDEYDQTTTFSRNDTVYMIRENKGKTYWVIFSADSNTTEYYYWKNKLFFIYYKNIKISSEYNSDASHSSDIKYTVDASEHRIYFYNNKPFHYLEKSINGDGKDANSLLSKEQNIELPLDKVYKLPITFP